MAPIKNSGNKPTIRINKNRSFSMGKNPKEKKVISSTYSSHKSGISRTPSKKSNVLTSNKVIVPYRNFDSKSDKTNSSSGKNVMNKPLISPGKPPSSNISTKLYSSQGAPKSSEFKVGLIWIPLRKRNKNKNVVYNSHQFEEPRKERRPSMYNIATSEDSTEPKHENYSPLKKKEESFEFEQTKTGVTVSAAAVAMSDASTDSTNIDSTIIDDFVDHSQDSKETSSDTNGRESQSLLENKSVSDNTNVSKQEKGKTTSDDVDSVALRLPRPNKVQLETNDEGCGIKCLYYTMQCCDCVIS